MSVRFLTMHTRRNNLSDSVTSIIGKTPIALEVSTTTEIPDEMASSGYDSPTQQEYGTEGEWVDGEFDKSAGKMSGSVVTVDGNTAAKATHVLRVLNEGADASVIGSGTLLTVEQHPTGSVKERPVWSPAPDGSAWEDENGRPMVLKFQEDFECEICPGVKCGRVKPSLDYFENEPYVPDSETSTAISQEGADAGSAQDYVGQGKISVYKPYKLPAIRYGLYDSVRKYLEAYVPKFTVADGKVPMKIMTSDGDKNESVVLENDDWNEPPNCANASSKVNNKELVRDGHSEKNRKLRKDRMPMQPVKDLNAKSPAATKSSIASGRPILALVTRDSKAHRILQILNEGVDDTDFFELQPIDCGKN